MAKANFRRELLSDSKSMPVVSPGSHCGILKLLLALLMEAVMCILEVCKNIHFRGTSYQCRNLKIE